MSDIADTLATLRARYETAGYANCDQRAVDTVVWALTAGRTEVEDRVRRYHEDQQPTLREAMNDGLLLDGRPKVHQHDDTPF